MIPFLCLLDRMGCGGGFDWVVAIGGCLFASPLVCLFVCLRWVVLYFNLSLDFLIAGK